jgi:uncharacterized protein
MYPMTIIEAYYPPGTRAFDVLVGHSRCVAEKALSVAENVGHLQPDLGFIYEAAMLHDVGTFMTGGTSLGSAGTHPYVCHGILGRSLLESRGLPRHALVCERHVGVGISPEDIDRQSLPLPRRDMRPVSIEEQIICYADKFYSKTANPPNREKSLEEIFEKLRAYGPKMTDRFLSCVAKFGNVA